jgi:ABC-type transport system involved in cytochrome c biogenesis permease subunit
MINWSRYVPCVVVGVAALYLLAEAMPPGDPDGKMQIQAFARLPVQQGGRIKPVQTVASNSLMVISDRTEVLREGGGTDSAGKWMLDMMTGKADNEAVIRIENDELLTMLGLKERPGSFRYSWNEIKAKIPEFAQKADEVRKRRRDGKPLDKVDEKLLTLLSHLELYLNLSHLEDPRTVPPARGDNWLTLTDAVGAMQADGHRDRATELQATMLVAYGKNQPAEFNKALGEYRQYLEREMPGTLRRTDFEYAFNHFAPFYQCAILYVAAFLLVCFSWVGYTQVLNRSAFGLLVLTLVVHTAALVGRMYLMERWFVFVTNLYSSAVFIGWGCLVLALILEGIFGNGIGNLVASVAGFVTMVIAHNLGSGDTLEMMQAVLDTNFWLATHVTCVTTGYTATFVAGLLGIVFILRGVLTPSLDRPTFVKLTQALYGVICFATLFSFTGTVLGGIWADQSWGRFWGWDPKENGALLIVLWNALVLHARWGGLVKQRGMAVLAVFGNIVTLWSWFGVNMLGVGLHSYGFMEFNAILLATFIPLHLGVIGLGVLPVGLWRSFGGARAEAPVPKLPLPDAPAPLLRPESTHVVAAR